MTATKSYFSHVSGKTLDGHRWGLSLEGGPDSSEPESPGRATGIVDIGFKLPYISLELANELAARLPTLTLVQAAELLGSMNISPAW